MDLISTGIRGFDNIIGGGMYPGSCILLVTAPVIETRIFLLEYIYKGVKAGEPALFVTTENSPEELNARMKGYKFSLNGERGNLLRWIDAYSYNISKNPESTETIKRLSGTDLLGDFSVGIKSAMTDFSAISNHSRFVFDSLSPIVINYGVKAMYKFLRQAIARLRSFNAAGFFVLGEGMHPKDVEMTIRHMMDGCMELNERMHLDILSLPQPSIRMSAQLRLTEGGFDVVDVMDSDRETTGPLNLRI